MTINEPIKTKLPKDQSLQCVVDGERLIISIGIDTLAFADAERTGIDVSNALEFAKDVATELLREEEDGSTPLTDLLDKVMEMACDNGSVGVEREVEVIINGRPAKLNAGFVTYEAVCMAANRPTDYAWTITYSKGWPHDSQGSLCGGDVVRAKRGMIFDVVDTSNA